MFKFLLPRFHVLSRRIAGGVAVALIPALIHAQEATGNTNEAALKALRAGDAEVAFEIWSRLAEEGNAAAQSNLGGLYLSPALGEPDYVQALSWFRRAAGQNNPAALVSLGHLYRMGIPEVLAPDREAAIGYFRRAAGQGSAEGAYSFGELALQDRPQDAQAAIEAIRDAAEAGFPPAMHRVATFLHSGTFTERDMTEAITWYDAAAARGYAESAYTLGEIHMNGEDGAVDMNAALAQFEKAAAAGLAEAQAAAGFIHLRELAASADPSRAAALFAQAAAQWNYRAMYYLGLQHFEGTGVGRDLVEAHKWFNLAANGRHVEAHFMRGAAAAALTPEEIARAEAAAQTWFDENHDAPHTHASLEPHQH